MKKFIQIVMLAFIAIVLLLPAIQYKLQIFDVKPLEGGVTLAEKPEFKKEDYWSLTWQEKYNTFINDNFGFRPLSIKLINQLRYSLLNTTKAPGVVIGNNEELFIESYIDEFIGKNFIGEQRIKNNVEKIKRLQDSLKAKGKDLIVVFAPGKPSLYPELIPEKYNEIKKDSTNYKSYAKSFNDQKVNFIDIKKWFTEKHKTFKYPVYPKYGAHWNHYGMTLALDSIVKYIEKKRNIDMPNFSYDVVNYSTNLKGNDFDIGILMNLLKPLDPDPNPYPIYKFNETGNFTKPNALVVGDSYWWCMVGDNLPIKFFKEDEYWFYNKDQYIKNEKRNAVKDINLSEAMNDRDVVVLMATEATYYMFPYGFVDNLYDFYCEDNSTRRAQLNQEINNNKDWFNEISQKAIQNNRSLEEQIRLDIDYVIADELKKHTQQMNEMIEKIKNNPDWMKDIKRKAIENKISIDEQIRSDAKWSLENP